MLLFIWIVMGAMTINASADESFAGQNEIEASETDMELHVSSVAENPEETDQLEMPTTMGNCCFSPYSTLFAGGSYSRVSVTPISATGTHSPAYSGNVWGVLVGYQYRKQDGLYAALQALWRQGATSGELGPDYLHECKVEERVGYDFAFGPDQNGSIALYMGIGYRFMEQSLKPIGLADMALAYNDLYVPIGTSVDYAIPFQDFCLSIGLSATWMPQIYPTVNIIPLGGARWIVEYGLANIVLELPITFACCNGFSGTIRPTFEYWKDGGTIAVGRLCDALGTPASSYLFGGFNLEFGWRF